VLVAGKGPREDVANGAAPHPLVVAAKNGAPTEEKRGETGGKEKLR
jgi:hypothetical protein